MSAVLLCALWCAACSSGIRETAVETAIAPPTAVRSEAISANVAPIWTLDAPDRAAVEPAPSMRLTASDGTGLALTTLEVASVIEDPLAFTELRMTFRNPENRVIEGRFEITLPPGAAISRFAMKIGDRWQEGEVVETQAARRAYEDFLHQRQDPALLEQDAGNQFRARVFPIPAQADKELILSYSQALRGAEEPYQVMLRGLPHLDRLHTRVQMGEGGEVFEVEEHDVVPDRDLRIVLDAPSPVGLRRDGLAVARIRPRLATADAPMEGLTVLFDTSASRVLGYRAAVERLQGVVAALVADQGDMPLQILAFDQEVAPIHAGPASTFGAEAVRALGIRGALGASDLGAALEHLATAEPHHRVLVVTDGIATAGATETASLRQAVGALDDVGVERLDVMVEGGIRDADLLAELVTAELPQAGVVMESTASATVVRRLSRATISGVKVQVPGASWVWPETLDGIQDADDVLIYAGLPRGRPMVVTLTGATLPEGPIPLEETTAPLLARAAARARIDRLQHQLARTEDAMTVSELKGAIVALSTQHRVLSDYTALLVLETEADYVRYGIERHALAEILMVGPEGLRVQRRDKWTVSSGGPGARNDDRRGPQNVAPLVDAPPPAAGSAAGTQEGSGGNPNMGGGAFNENTYLLDGVNIGGGNPNMAGGVLNENAPVEGVGGNPNIGGAVDVQATSVGQVLTREFLERIPAGRSYQTAVQFVAGVSDPGVEPALAPEVIRMAEERARAGSISQAAAISQSLGQPAPLAVASANVSRGWTGPFARIMALIEAGKLNLALERALAWRASEPGDVLALLALGEVWAARGDAPRAARALGSVLDLFPSRADLRRMTGQRLESLGEAGGLLAVDTYAKALEQRPDHPSSHRLYAYALLRLDRHEEAFDVLVAANALPLRAGRFRGVDRILAEDVGLVGAAWKHADPDAGPAIDAAVAKAGGVVPDGPSVRFLMYWETDANDVDLHVYDGYGGHASYQARELASGGLLYADVTTGYGPECFTIHDARAFPYTLQAHYYRMGPMGYGMGTLQVVHHDGTGGLAFDDHPYVIMRDGATVTLGTVVQ